MTVEELDIIVNASVENALQEFNKLVPSVQKAIKQMTEKINSTDFSSFKSKVHQAVNFVKIKMDNLIRSNKNNELAIKVNNKDAKEQVSQLEKEIDSLQKKISARELKLNITNSALDQIRYDTNQEVIKDMPNAGTNRISQQTELRLFNNDNYMNLVKQSDKLNNEIIRYNSLLDGAKSKMSELGQETTQNKLSSFFSGLKGKIQQSISHVKGLKGAFNQIPGVTKKIVNSSSGIGSSLKSNFKHILKYAGALLSIRGIYGLLRGAANAWLSSQNAEAKQLNSNIEYMKYAMGSTLAPVIQFVTNLVYQLMKAIQMVAYALTGVNIFAKATATSMKSTAKSAKDTNKSLSSVHSEINNVSENNSGSGSSSLNMDLSGLSNTSNSILDAIKNGDWYEVGSLIAEKLNEAMYNIPWEKIQNTARNIGKGTAQLLNGFIATADWYEVGNTFAQGLNTAIYFAYEVVTTFDWQQFGTAIGKSVNGFFNNVDWENAGKTISTGIIGVFNSIKAFLEEVDWVGIAVSVVTFLTSIDWIGMLNGFSDIFFESIATLLGTLGVFIGGLIAEAFNGIEQYFQNQIEECGGNVVLGILKGITDALLGIGDWIAEHIFMPIIKGFKNAFGIHSPSTVMAKLGIFIIQGLFEGILSLIDTVIEIWNNLKNKTIEIITNVKEKVVDKISEMKNNTIEKFNEIKDKAIEKVTSLKTNAVNIFSNLKTSISTTIGNIKSTIVNGFESAVSYIKSLPGQALNWGRDIIGNIVNGITSKIGDLGNSIKNVASVIASYIHFTEPDIGPLSNFHTYMPDMIDLMVNGIHTNIGRVTKELENLTGQMSYTINTPDINPILPNINNEFKSTIQPRNIMKDTLSDLIYNNENNVNITIPLSIYVGNKKIGQILIEDLRDMKRRTGKDIEAIVGG